MIIKDRAKQIFRSFRVINSIYGSVLTYRRMKNYESLVRKFDEDIDTSKWSGSVFLKNYFVPKDLKKPIIFDESGFSDTHSINCDYASIAKTVTLHFKEFIIKYLGEDVRLDNIVLSWFDPERCSDDESISGSWHNDNVGHRLKIYICLKGDGSTPTVVEPNSHRRPYRASLSELARFYGKKNFRKRKGQVELRYKTGDVAMFDTHLMHRGRYDLGASERVCLILEYMNRKKSNALTGLVACGPQGGPKGLCRFSKEAMMVMKTTGFIDESLISEDEFGFTYSTGNILNKL